MADKRKADGTIDPGATTRDIAIPERQFDALQLGQITSFEDALAAFDQSEVDSIDNYGDGFTLADKEIKYGLIGMPFVILSHEEREGDYERDGQKESFAVVRVVTQDGRKFMLTDGSTGLRDQLRLIRHQRGTCVGLICRKGFQPNPDYVHPEFGKATTFRIDMAP